MTIEFNGNLADEGAIIQQLEEESLPLSPDEAVCGDMTDVEISLTTFVDAAPDYIAEAAPVFVETMPAPSIDPEIARYADEVEQGWHGRTKSRIKLSLGSLYDAVMSEVNRRSGV